ncbi:FMN-binding glutamate synthase family protein [Pleionea litopenaei]|uniref:FMN-binding glutamate synthase family protein n=1 Tax=Pleionea litopenaei TaxID=3070815 RepID=A0AA51RVG3_9GAMM|nr:FMN-binding glutamate synthase family protein [Pleionea sp. HL-JVS1]WMS88250.1 FMN-binding glutamate synthase family protein [Pleionea sp. HL-JVS1]
MTIDSIAFNAMIYLAFAFAVLLTLLVVVAIVLYIIDITQTRHTIRRNYPLIGRFRYWFEHLGEFFRQYFFAMDREELPFNRSERSWVYRAAKNENRTIAFGSTRDLTEPGTIIFMNSAFPTLEEDATEATPLLIGPYCQSPYTAKRFFNVSGMSYGALSKPAITALSKGAKEAGCWLNTGEGGLSEHHLAGGCDIVMQIGTAKYGVRNEEGHLSDEKLKEVAAIDQVKMFELKLSQGAKPGKGGILPAEKVTSEIAKIRGIAEGKASISPNAHPEIKSPDDLLDMINHIRDVTGKPVGFKAVLGDLTWVVQLFESINQRGIESAPDFITLDSADGGTGAAPQPLMDYMGLTIRESLPWLVKTLTEFGLRDRIKVITSGKMITPSRVAWALCIGADFVVSARGFMFSLGCIQALQCNKNTCPTGITTHNKKLQKGLNVLEKAKRVASYHRYIEYDVGMIAHSCGVSDPRKLTHKHIRIVQDNGTSLPVDEL